MTRIAALTFLTGFSSLVLELTWQKYLANLFGSQYRSEALVVAVFLGSLTMGYAYFGKISIRRSPHWLVKACGIMEIVIGVWAIGFLAMYAGAARAALTLPALQDYSFAIDALLTALMIGPPAFLMGCTYPLLTAAFASTDSATTSRRHALIYSLNTLGAFVGAWAAGFVLLPHLGMRNTALFAAFVSLSAGISLIACSRGLPHAAQGQSQAVPPQLPLRYSFRSSYAIACAVGFSGMALQVAAARLFGLSVGSSEYTFSIIVSVYVLLLALGASDMARAKPLVPTLTLNLGIALSGLILVYAMAPLLPYFMHVLRSLHGDTTLSFYLFQLTTALTATLLLAVPVTAFGRAMPLIFNHDANDGSDAGRRIGTLYAWNAVGSVTGALIGGHWILEYFNLDTIIRLSALVLAVALLLSLRGRVGRKAAVITVVAGLVILGLPKWDPIRFAQGLFLLRNPTDHTFSGPSAFYANLPQGQRDLLFYKDAPNGTVSVTERKHPTGDGRDLTVRAIFSNGRPDSSTWNDDLRTTRLLAHLPALLRSPTGGRAAVIGYGTGITAGTLLRYPDIERVDCFEINAAVRDAAPWFGFANGEAQANPKLNWVIADAYRGLMASTERYDLIVSQPSNPWVAGGDRLFSYEFYERAKSRLHRGGVFSQWIQLYDISDEALSMVIATFTAAFPNHRVFQSVGDIILIGSDTPIGADRLGKLVERMGTDEISKDLESVLIHSVEGLLSFEVTARSVRGDASVNRIDRPRLSYLASRDFFKGKATQSATIHHRVTQSLFSSWTSIKELTTDTLRDVALTQCGSLDTDAFNRAQFSPLCPASLAILVSRGQMEGGRYLTGEQAKIISWLLGESNAAPKTLSMDSIGQILALYHRLNSYLVPMDPDRLMEAAKPCLTETSTPHLICRTHLIESLATAGHAKLARQVLDGISPADQLKIPPAVQRHLRALVSTP